MIDDGGDPDAHPHPELVRTTLELAGLGIGPGSAIVVATQGHYDDLALEVALATDAGYIGLVAAEKRAAAALELLRGRGITDEQLLRVAAPAGLTWGRWTTPRSRSPCWPSSWPAWVAGVLRAVAGVGERHDAVGYVVATAASLLIGKPVKWIETRSENLISTGFAHDYYMKGELALSNDGKIQALRVQMLSDQGAFYSDAQPTKFKAGLFHVVTGSYDYPAAHVVCAGAYTNKAPGGVAYRCSFRITEASFLIERLVQTAAYELGMDPAEIRFKNFIQPEQFPYHTPTGFVYDSGDYPTALHKALDAVGYDALREEQLAARAEGRLLGIGIAHFTEAVGAGPSHTYDIAGLKMFDSAELRVHPTGKAILKLGVKTQGQGHETTFAQIVAEELGIPVTDVKVMEGDTDNTPYGLGTYASRSTPVAGAATAMVARKLADKAKIIAAHLLEAAPEDIELKAGDFFVKGTPSRSVSIQDVALAAYTNMPDGLEHGLEGVHYYDPPNLTYPFGSYVVVVEVDAETGVWKVQRMVALDDCGVRINPMIVEGQIHGGLTEGFAMSSMQWITFDDEGNCIGSNFMDYLIPTAWETPRFELLETCTPSPHHPIGAKGVGESATVGSPAAFVNAVIDAVAHLGVRNIDMPLLPDRVWAAIQSAEG